MLQRQPGDRLLFYGEENGFRSIRNRPEELWRRKQTP